MAAQNALEIVRVGRLTSPYSAAYEVLHEDPTYRLRRYQGTRAARGDVGPPLLLVPPLMVATEVYDIEQAISAVAYLVREGVDVWVVDFGAPEREKGGLERTLDDHVRAVSDAIGRVKAETGRDVHLGGYSQGGMFAYQAAAYRRSADLASVITWGSPVNIYRSLPQLSEGVAERLAGPLKAALSIPLERAEAIPGVLSSSVFRLLNARKELSQMVDFITHLHDRQALERRESKRLFLRGEGFVAWPGPALRKFVDDMIVANRLTLGGLVIDGRAVALSDIRCPIFYFIGERDEIAFPDSVRGIRKAAPQAEIHEATVKAGHFGLVVGTRAMEVTWPAVAQWIRWRAGEGPKPAILDEDEAPPLDKTDLERIDETALDVELFYDVFTKAADALVARVGDAASEAAESIERIRYQLPRLQRLRSIDRLTRISMGLELAEQAQAIPERTFFLHRGRAFSYAEANARVDNVARGLIACGVAPGVRVAVLMGNRPSFLSAVVAVNRIGAISVLLDPAAADVTLSQQLKVGGAQVLIADPEHAQAGRGAFDGDVLVLGAGGRERRLHEGVIDMEAIDPEAVKMPAWFWPNPGRAKDLAMVLVSSPGIGEPRAAQVSNHRWAFSALGAAATATLTTRDTVYACLPLHHAGGAMVAAGSALVGGTRLALAERFDPEVFWPEVRRYGATVVFYAGEMCRQLVDAPRTRGERNHPVRLFAGSGMRKDVWDRLQERFGPVGVLEFYASTETNAVLGNASGRPVGSVGRPIPGSSQVVIARYDQAERELVRTGQGRCIACADDETGMLLAKLSPEADPEPPPSRVVTDAFAAGDAWYITGDLVRRDAGGDYWYVARASELIHTSGGRVAPRAIEDALYRVPGVALAVAFGVPALGTQHELAGAAVVLRPGSVLAPKALRDELARLDVHARPRFVRVVEALPMTDGYRPLRAPLRVKGAPPRTDPHTLWYELERDIYVRRELER
jgi:putative long chain acyl-CoA synthase